MIPLLATLPEADRTGWRDEIGKLDTALYSAIAATPTPTLDRSFRALSRAADHSKLWSGTAAALAAAGDRPGPRAAVSHLASVALTSAVVNPEKDWSAKTTFQGRPQTAWSVSSKPANMQASLAMGTVFNYRPEPRIRGLLRGLYTRPGPTVHLRKPAQPCTTPCASPLAPWALTGLVVRVPALFSEPAVGRQEQRVVPRRCLAVRVVPDCHARRVPAWTRLRGGRGTPAISCRRAYTRRSRH